MQNSHKVLDIEASCCKNERAGTSDTKLLKQSETHARMY